MSRPLVVAALLLCLSAGVLAQQATETIDLQVRIFYSNDRRGKAGLMVALLTGIGSQITQNFTDDSGYVEFRNLRPGNYKLRVSDVSIETVTSDMITLHRSDRFRSEMITVTAKAAADAQQKNSPTPTIASVDLNVPRSAEKEFEKGVKAMARNDLAEAQARFQRAIQTYPQYASAYNHLGVLYMRQGMAAEGQQAFEKAVSLNDRYANALINLVKVRAQQQQQDLNEIERLLQQALSVEPMNPEGLLLLANVQLLTGRPGEAFTTARRVHDQPHEAFPACHYVAARALEAQNNPAGAIAEYLLLLQESPTGPAADRARTAVAKLRQQGPQP